MESFLSIDDVNMSFRGLDAISHFSGVLEKGRIYGLIGTNGAGKTTLINILSGQQKPTSGSILFEGRQIAGLRADKVARLGIGRTYQNLRLFDKMSLIDNVCIGAQMRNGYNVFDALVGTPKFRREEKDMRAFGMNLLDMMGLKDLANGLAGSLPYGSQRLLEIARTLATRPKLLLLDEPAAGMNPRESADLIKIIKLAKEEFGLTILLIEHDMKVVMGICEYIYVMAFGQTIFKGNAEQVVNDKNVIEAYLGRADADA